MVDLLQFNDFGLMSFSVGHKNDGKYLNGGTRHFGDISRSDIQHCLLPKALKAAFYLKTVFKIYSFLS